MILLRRNWNLLYRSTFGNFVYCLVEIEGRGKIAEIYWALSVRQSLMKELQISHDHIVNLTEQIFVFFSPRIWGTNCRKYFNDLRERLCGCILYLLYFSLYLLWIWVLEILKSFVIFPWRKSKLSDFCSSPVQDI